MKSIKEITVGALEIKLKSQPPATHVYALCENCDDSAYTATIVHCATCVFCDKSTVFAYALPALSFRTQAKLAAKGLLKKTKGKK